ncbi:glycosyltransferase family 4 protein [Draconibacterium orientale]|uniref:glycosyltransferase family 4 protein n=1 Tax=Draconibacterium orientale TaxID=1168034 RepID=UPI002A0A3108|nr:glycosyltransferase family 4 protein [Draconibacterium orientale]
MKNILLLTSVYPAEDFPKDTTPVVHYFTREWAKQGYHVKVIQNLVYYPKIAYFILYVFEKVISKFYNFLFRTKGYTKEKHYYFEEVEVHRLPIFKKFPLSLYSRKEQEKQLNRIKNLVASKKFTPDIIIGHWANPQLYQVIELGKIYPARTCIVMHSDVKIINRMFGKRSKEIIDKIDIWGFRSIDIKNKFENQYGVVNKSFLCYSGIPPNKINLSGRTFKNGIQNFLFVGLLIPRKYPEVLIKAVNTAYQGKDFHITYIGTGREKVNIERLAKKLNISEKISILGRVSREEVYETMKVSDCFIMLSKPETFGLVYLEAMSMGCITIGSKREGIDGVIKHGKNGFLSDAGDYNKLAELLDYISFLPEKELCKISNNAIKTASDLTDEKVAKRYLDSIKAAKLE